MLKDKVLSILDEVYRRGKTSRAEVATKRTAKVKSILYKSFKDRDELPDMKLRKKEPERKTGAQRFRARYSSRARRRYFRLYRKTALKKAQSSIKRNLG